MTDLPCPPSAGPLAKWPAVPESSGPAGESSAVRSRSFGFGVPDGVARLRIPVAVGTGEETAVDVELEEPLVDELVRAQREL